MIMHYRMSLNSPFLKYYDETETLLGHTKYDNFQFFHAKFYLFLFQLSAFIYDYTQSPQVNRPFLNAANKVPIRNQVTSLLFLQRITKR